MSQRRIEVTDVDLERKEVSVDFEFGDVLVNINFRLSDLKMLKALVSQLEAEFKDLEGGC